MQVQHSSACASPVQQQQETTGCHRLDCNSCDSSMRIASYHAASLCIVPCLPACLQEEVLKEVAGRVRKEKEAQEARAGGWVGHMYGDTAS
jgi:hypothetical protein